MPRVGSPILVHRLWVALLIFCLTKAPLPAADFHAIRHFHGRGQLCPMHDHLVRWHSSDVLTERSVLHFHWVSFGFPAVPFDETSGPVVRAELHDPFDLHLYNDITAEEASFSEEDESRSRVAKPSRFLLADLIYSIEIGLARKGVNATCTPPSRNFGATFTTSHPTTSLLQRWAC